MEAHFRAMDLGPRLPPAPPDCRSWVPSAPTAYAASTPAGANPRPSGAIEPTPIGSPPPLETPRLVEPSAVSQCVLGLAHHRQIPERRIVLGQRHVAPVHPSRGAPAFAETASVPEGQAPRHPAAATLRATRASHIASSVRPLTSLVVAPRAVPSLPVSGVDRLEHIPHAFTQLVFLRHLEGDPRVLDARLARLSRRPSHRVETRIRGSDALGRQPQHGLQTSAAFALRHRWRGWPHTNISSSRLSAIIGMSSLSVDASTRRLLAVCSRVFRARAPSRSRFRAATINRHRGWPARLVAARHRAPGQRPRQGVFGLRPRPPLPRKMREKASIEVRAAFSAARRPWS